MTDVINALGNLCPGMSFRCKDGHLWIYLGYRVTSVDTADYQFVRALCGSRGISRPLWTYNASKLETLIAKFPALGLGR